MTMLHQWLQEEYRLGTAEPGEACRGCRRQLALYERCVTLRQRHLERDLWGPPIEIWCMTCVELLDGTGHAIVIGPRGGQITRQDAYGVGIADLTAQFWSGKRDEKGRPQDRQRKVF